MIRLAAGAPLTDYAQQAVALLAAWRAGDDDGVQLVRHNHPRFLDGRVPWLPKPISGTELRAEHIELADAQLALARAYSFRDWPHLVEWVAAVMRPDSAVGRFEAAVEAVIHGDTAALRRLSGEDASLVHQRSTVVTWRDPPEHCATLLHYVAANGVEDYRQKTPPNAVEIASLLLQAGAEPDALAGMYRGQHTTLNMLVSSVHPARAGVQVALIDTLVDYGAAVDGLGPGGSESPLLTALACGYVPAAEALIRRGARVDNLAAVAGLGRLDDAHRLLPDADADTRHRALALAAQHGRTEVLKLLLDAGEDPSRYNPEGFHAHSTPLHQAAYAGHIDTVQLLVERGARLDVVDTVWQTTPLRWAEHGGRTAIAEFLGARIRTSPS